MPKKAKTLKADSYVFYFRTNSDNPDIPLIMDVLEDHKLEGGPIPYRLSENMRSGMTEIWVDSTRIDDATKFVY